MKRALITALAVVLVAGCASPTMTWTKPGTTDSGYAQDLRDCDRDANKLARAEGKPGHQQWSTQGARQASASGGLEALRRVEHDETISACMKAKGYEKAS